MLLTLSCKMSAFLAERTRRAWALSWLDLSIAWLQKSLAKEAVFCMGKVTRWQKKAGNCLAFHKRAESLLENGKEKKTDGKRKV